MYILKLKPALKDYLWGGTKLKTEYGMQSTLDKVAEAWVLSTHKDGQSTVVNGALAGQTLEAAVASFGRGCLGKNGEKFSYFPILIKLIDAKKDLSVQVHPDDAYALEHEGEYGKTEMWYVVDAEPGASLYHGFKKEISREEFKRRIEDNTLTEVLNRAPVQPGDCFFIESGTIHAIGSGILIAEIQQNSNTTYRVSDYGRLGADGKPRPLHIAQAVAVTKLTPPAVQKALPKDCLAQCDYFKVRLLVVNGSATRTVDDSSFTALLCLDGTVQVGDVSLGKGECAFIPAGFGVVELRGNGRLIESRV